MTATDPFGHHDHHACTAAALTAAEARVAATGARLTPVRRRTLEILLEGHRAMGAYEVLDRLAADGFGHQPPVAYRALDFLTEHGLAHRVQRLNAFAACVSPGHDHAPAFLICHACDTVAETAAPALRTVLEQKAVGFCIERMTIEAVGLCRACSKAEVAS